MTRCSLIVYNSPFGHLAVYLLSLHPASDAKNPVCEKESGLSLIPGMSAHTGQHWSKQNGG